MKFILFQHTAARRRLIILPLMLWLMNSVSTHSRPKAAETTLQTAMMAFTVSTHSRPKAAGNRRRTLARTVARFNTQPPEGGCCWRAGVYSLHSSFNTQPPEGGWQQQIYQCRPCLVSTHSRPKAAGQFLKALYRCYKCVSTHSRPKAAAKIKDIGKQTCLFQHTAARRRLGIHKIPIRHDLKFQHTAARRRLFKSSSFSR